MKLDALQVFTWGMIVVSSLFDFATTEVLLKAGSVQVGDTIVSFSEANPLFHILGYENFVIVYALTTMALIILTFLLPKIVPRKKSLYQVALLTLSVYGMAHLILGLKNYLIIQTYW